MAKGIEPGDNDVSGMADRPNGEITVAFPGGKTVATPTDENGSWKVDVPSGAEMKPSDDVTMTDVTGNKSTGPVDTVAGTCAATVVSISAGTLIYDHFVPERRWLLRGVSEAAELF